MKTFTYFFLFITCLILMKACANKTPIETGKSDELYDTAYSINTSGYMENGQLLTKWNWPDSKFFPPIKIKSWNKTRVINGRLPTYKETVNGTSILYYGKKNPEVKPYHMTLPKLAYYINPDKVSKFHFNDSLVIVPSKPEIVVVIEIVQTPKDTIVGYRYLTGGCGGALFRDFRFLTDAEVKKVIEEKMMLCDIPIKRVYSSESWLKQDNTAIPVGSINLRPQSSL